jgi:hypothetical protein
MRARSWEVVTPDKPTVVTKPIFYAVVVEDLECDRCFPDPPCTDKSYRFQVFGETDDLLDQFVTSKTSVGWRGR